MSEKHIGKVIQVIGPVLDIQFKDGELPELLNAIEIEDVYKRQEVSTPVSMAFRHFGNILSGTVISTLLYWALASLSHVLFGWLPGVLGQIQLFQIGIPAFTGLYFDWFGGCIQAFIFCTLTAIFIKRAAGEE